MLSRASYVIILAALMAPTAWAQEAAKVCGDGRTIKIASQWDRLTTIMAESEAAAQPLRYSISETQGVQARGFSGTADVCAESEEVLHAIASKRRIVESFISTPVLVTRFKNRISEISCGIGQTNRGPI